LPEIPLFAVGLAFLVPLGYAMIAVAGLPEDRAHHAALGTVAALGLSVLGYVATGFALQYGGAGLAHLLPGYDGLIWEWSALGVTWGAGWGMAGLAGWGLAGPAMTPASYTLAFAALPWVATACLIPLVSLRGRIPAWAVGLLGFLMGAVIYPLGGNWIWGGGWLANLGSNLGLGHGFVDAGGAGLVHLLGASAAAAGMVVFVAPHREPRPPANDGQVPMPPVHLPLLAVLGSGLLLAGMLAWTVMNPLLPLATQDVPRMALNGVLAAAAGAFLPLLYSWFVAGRADPLMATRGLAAGTVAVAAAAPFVAPWAALTIGGAAGLLIPLAVYAVDHVLRWDDPTAALTVHGLSGLLGVAAVGLFADGSAAPGWNGVGAESYLGSAGQGVTGLLAAVGMGPDWPSQMQAQIIGLVALMLLGFFAAWLFLAPLAILSRLAGWRPAAPARVSETADAAMVAVGGHAAEAAVNQPGAPIDLSPAEATPPIAE